ncbi:MAG TPA: hypothetical protein ENI54_02175 [bacterium]|nr:hypothetical protein [bacterium]
MMINNNDMTKILDAKATEFSDIVEQDLEEILTELISNNYKRHNVDFETIIKNDTMRICNEINKLVTAVTASPKNKKKMTDYKKFLPEIVRLIKFTANLKSINNAIVLIKFNIGKLYGYPTFKKQAYIPNFTLAVSSFFKENIDIFFLNGEKDINAKNRTNIKLKKIMYLGHKILNEFMQNTVYENKDDINVANPENQVMYYSNIISLLELISINSLEFTTI